MRSVFIRRIIHVMKKLITTIANFIIDVGTVMKFMSIAATCTVVYISMGFVLFKLHFKLEIAGGVSFGVSAILFIYMFIKFISSQYELSMLRDRVEALKDISGNTENMKNTIPGTAEASSRAKYLMGFAGSTINYTRDAFNLFGIIVVSLLLGLYAAGLVGDLQSSYCENSIYGCVNLPIVSFVVFIVVLVVWVSKFALSKYMYYLRQEEHDCLISIAFNLEIISGKIRNIQFIQKPIPPGQETSPEELESESEELNMNRENDKSDGEKAVIVIVVALAIIMALIGFNL